MRAFFVEGDAVQETADYAEVRRLYAAGRTVWVDLHEQSPEADDLLASTFKLHPLVIEDVWSDRPLPKIEDFADYLYVRVHGVRAPEDNPRFSKLPGDLDPHATSAMDVSLVEVDIVLGQHFVVTHHPDSCAVNAVREELARSARVLDKGPAWVVHDVLDHLVDHYLPILDQFADDIARLEERALETAGTPAGTRVMRRLLAMRRALQSVRRVSVHQRDILLRLSRGDFDEIPLPARPFFRDVYDHFQHTTDLAEDYRETVTSAIEAYLSAQSNRMNEVMKTLTLMSTVMLPLTFIAGLYGMNFEHMPELHWRFGYPMALALMAAVAGGIILWFRHKRWL